MANGYGYGGTFNLGNVLTQGESILSSRQNREMQMRQVRRQEQLDRQARQQAQLDEMYRMQAESRAQAKEKRAQQNDTLAARKAMTDEQMKSAQLLYNVASDVEANPGSLNYHMPVLQRMLPGWNPGDIQNLAPEQISAEAGKLRSKLEPVLERQTEITHPKPAPAAQVNIGPQTEGQRKDQFLYQTVNNALSDMEDSLEKFDPTTLKSAAIGLLPTTVSNFFKSADFQKYTSAARPIIEAYLTKLTGAAYTEIQQSGAVDTYLPQPGDKPETVRDKIARIRQFAAQLKQSAGYDVSDKELSGSSPKEDKGHGEIVDRKPFGGGEIVKYKDGHLEMIK